MPLIPREKLALGEPVEWKSAAAEPRQIGEAPSGEFLCFGEARFDENEVVFASGSDCRNLREASWSRYSVETGARLEVLDRLGAKSTKISRAERMRFEKELREANPGGERCAQRMKSRVAPELQRIPFSCRSAGEPFRRYLWTPPKEYAMPPGIWGKDFGEHITYHVGELPDPYESAVVDLPRAVLYELPKPMYLVEDRLFFDGNARDKDRGQFEITGAVEVFHLNQNNILESLGELECRGRLKVLHNDGGVISFGCGDGQLRSENCGNTLPLLRTTTMDLRERRKVTTNHQLVGVTKNYLIFAATKAMGSKGSSCDVRELLSVPR